MSGVRRSANEVLAIVACPDRHESAGGGRLRERAPALPFLLRPKRKLIEDTFLWSYSTGNTVSSSPAVANGFLSSRSGFRLQAPSQADYGTSI